MQVNIIYLAQVKKAVGIATETIEIAPCSVQDVITLNLCKRHDKLKSFIFNSDGLLSKTIKIFMGDSEIDWDSPVELKEGTDITIMSPIMGG